MRKTTLIIAAIIILFLVSGGVYVLFGKSHNIQAGQEVSSQSQQLFTQKKSLLDFLSTVGSLKCAYSDKTSGSSGTVYTSGGKMRGDFTTTDNGKAKQSHIINDTTYVYIWTNGEKNGYKMPLQTFKKEASQVSVAPGNISEQTPSQAVNMKQQADYSCGPWSVDASLFAVPTNVTFTDYSSMMQSMPTVPPQEGINAEQKQAACSACNQVPAGAMRNQCLTQLKCQ